MVADLITLPNTAQSPESWRRQIAEVCERAGMPKPNRHSVTFLQNGTKMFDEVEIVCAIVRRNFTITPDNLEAVKAGIRLYLGMDKDNVINRNLLMAGK